MRTTVCAILLTLGVTGCSGGHKSDFGGQGGNNSSSDQPADGIVPRLKEGDVTVCADRNVQRAGLKTFVNASTLDQFLEHGGRLVFDTISASGMNKDISEVTCSANLNYNGGHNPIQYKVRPIVDQSGGFVVETTFPDTSNLNKYIEIVEEDRASQQAGSPAEMRQSGTGQAASEGAQHIGQTVDAEGNVITPKLIGRQAWEKLSAAKRTKELERRWVALETECRGGPHQQGDAVCTARDRLMNVIESRGVCWAYRDDRVSPPDYNWHPCREARPKGWHPDGELENSSG